MKPTKSYSRGKMALILATALVFVSACAGIGAIATPTATRDSVSTDVAATLQALTPAATAANTVTSIPPTSTAVPPTPTLLPPSMPPPTRVPEPAGAVRINFLSGATTSQTDGTISPGHVQNYLVRALKGQPMIVRVDSPNQGLNLSIYGLQSGQVLLPSSEEQNSWQGILPVTDDYVIQVIGGPTGQNFNLSLTIASPIEFDPGAVSATVSGTTQGGFNVTYAVYAFAGQTMNINLSPLAGNAVLEVWGFSDGQPYLRSATESTTFSMKLPTTQDYIVAVVPFAGQVVDFNMKVEVK